MPRTFSLARLFLAITLFCFLCGLAVYFPIFGRFCAPSVIVLVWFVCFSNEPILMALFCFGGACAGGMFLPWLVFAVLGDPRQSPMQQNQLADLALLMCAPAGALLVGGAIVLLEICYPPPVLPNNNLDRQTEQSH